MNRRLYLPALLACMLIPHATLCGGCGGGNAHGYIPHRGNRRFKRAPYKGNLGRRH